MEKESTKREELSLELNFRSFLAGEGGPFFQPVPLEEMVNIASVGCPVTIPAGGPYNPEELLQIAAAVARGAGAMTLAGSAAYPQDLLRELEKQCPGRLKLA
jgi:hypothetical protein